MGGCRTANTLEGMAKVIFNVLINTKEKELGCQLKVGSKEGSWSQSFSESWVQGKPWESTTKLQGCNTAQVHFNMESVSSGSSCKINILRSTDYI